MPNLISGVIAPADKIEILNLLGQIRAKLNFEIAITPDQLEDVAKLADGRLPFAQKSLVYGEQNAVIVPPFTDLIEHGKDLTFFSDLEPIEIEILKLAEIVSAYRAAAGADAYRTARMIYSIAQKAAAAGVPGMQAIVDDLKILYEGQGIKKA